MELAQELFVTAVVAVLFSFVIAKLVSVAMSDCESVDGSKVGGSGGDAVVGDRGAPFMEKVRFGEEKLTSPSVGSERRVVEAVQEELRTVDRFGDQPVMVEKVVVEPSVYSEEAGLESGEAADEPSEIKELLEKLSEKEDSGEVEILADEMVKCDVEETEGNDEEFLREANQLRDVEETEGNDEEFLRGANQLRDVEVYFPVVEAGEAADVVVEEEKEIVDEDDWEGIERSELEKDFAAAARFVDDRKDRLEAAMGDDAKMQLYGLHKVATEGPCRDSPPIAVKVAARAKWNAWQRLGNMSPDLAMGQYINLLSESIPSWSKEMSAEMGKSNVITLQQQDSPLGAASGHQAESVGFGQFLTTLETSVAAEVNLGDPGHEANSVGKAKE